jgi:hypothetical protein
MSVLTCPHIDTRQAEHLDGRRFAYLAGINQPPGTADCEVCRKLLAHDDLLVSCKTLKMWLEKLRLADVFPGKLTGQEWTILQENLEFVRAAIAKAEGAQP